MRDIKGWYDNKKQHFFSFLFFLDGVLKSHGEKNVKINTFKFVWLLNLKYVQKYKETQSKTVTGTSLPLPLHSESNQRRIKEGTDCLPEPTCALTNTCATRSSAASRRSLELTNSCRRDADM